MNLTLVKKDGQYRIDSRQVAQQIGKEHKNLCRDIEGYIKDMSGGQSSELSFDGQNPKLDSDVFFKKSSYRAGTGKSYTCYLLSRKGCEFVGNKMTGAKGTLFTAAYVTAFHDMEEKARFHAARQVDVATKKALGMAASIQKHMGVKAGIAQAVCLGMMEAEYGVDLEPVKKLIPAATHETGFLIPSEIGKRLNMNAAKTNLLIAGMGLQEKSDGEWRLTEAGRGSGEEMPYVRNGHSGYQIRWNESVVDLLKTSMAAGV